MRIAIVAALAAGLLAPAGGPPVSPQTIFVDTLTTPGAQHATAVEPDTFAFGDTVVAAFQVGRYTDGGAAAIGWATSADGGRTWGSGLLPGLTAATLPGGPFTRVTDPAVAYDRVHGVWLVAVLALRGEDSISSLVVTRSRDGRAWSPPATAAPEVGEFAHDKSWIACDSGRSSPHAGRCYVTWTDVASEEIVVARSRDGGLTWGEPVEVGIVGTGSQPVARPDGSLVVLGLGRGVLAAARSRDGGASFAPQVRVGDARVGDTAGMRAPPLPSVEVDRGGRIYAAWHHCGLSPLCSRHVVVLSSSADGAVWTPPVAIAAGPGQTILPGLAVDPTTSGPRTRLALAYYRLTEVGCPTASCIAPEYVSSSDAGSSWSAPVALAAVRPIWMLAEARGRFAGDYVSTSFVTAGVAVPVVSAATAPPDGHVLHQAIVSAAIPPLPAARLVPLTLGRAAASPARPRAGAAVTVSASLAGPIHGVRAHCRASVGPSVVRAVAEAAGEGRARCTWRLPRGSSGKRLAGTIVVTAEGRSARRAFSFRVR